MDTVRKHTWRRPAIGMFIAIAITTLLIAMGLSELSAFSLIPLLALFWYLERFSRAETGFVWGRARDYRLALLYPGIVLSLAALIAWITSAINLQNTDVPDAALRIAVTVLVTIPLAIITEEGFFRGWLWASLKRAGQNKVGILVWTSVAFAAWHLPVVLLETVFTVPLAQAAVYILNVAIASAIMGLMRLITGSVVVASVSHGIWNGLAYGFFGTGLQVGALGIENGALYNPESGVVGLVLNLVFLIALWQWYRRAGTRLEAPEMPAAATLHF